MDSRRSRLHNIQSRILNLNEFPSDVLETAVAEYDKLDIPIPRSENRNRIICYCICQAYIRLGYAAIDPVSVGRKLGMTGQQSNIAVNSRPKYKQGHTSISPTVAIAEILNAYCIKILGLPTDITESMFDLLNQLLVRAPHLVTMQAKILVIAFIYGYINKNSMIVKRDQLANSLFLENDRKIEPTLREIEEAMIVCNLAF